MNEKTKRILSYVACTFGGVALGIALLGGLSYCSVSEKAEQTEVNTILNTAVQPKGEKSTGSVYDRYHFTITAQWPSETGHANAYAYGVETSTYTLSVPEYVEYSNLLGYNSNKEAILNLVNTYYPTATSTLRFVAYFAKSVVFSTGTPIYTAYFSFLISNPSITINPKTFIMTTTWTSMQAIDINNGGWLIGFTGNKNVILNNQRSNAWLVDQTGNQPPTTFTFQDVASYYADIGYSSGYDDGYDEGNNVGYWAGYNDGVGTAGNFTNISGNVNAVIDLSDLGVTTTGGYSHGLSDSKYYTLLQFRDQDQESWTVQIEDGVASDQPTGTRTAYLNLYSPNDGYKGWIGYAVRDSSISTFRVQQTNEFSFEFATVYNVLGRSLTQEYVLIWGWASDNVSYQAGYNAGYADGFEGTNVNNVFSLFTGAFNAVGGIFNLKVFGFLPLYWFFLTPIFIAIIALLLRMIKH